MTPLDKTWPAFLATIAIAALGLLMMHISSGTGGRGPAFDVGIFLLLTAAVIAATAGIAFLIMYARSAQAKKQTTAG